MTTVAGVPGLAGSADGPARVATFNRPTWLDVLRDEDCVVGKAGDVVVVDRANRSLRWIANGSVKTLTIATSLQNANPVVFEYGGPFGGGIAVEPRGGGCGCSYYARGVWVSMTAVHQLMLASMEGIPGGRDDIAPIIGARGELIAPTGIALSQSYARDFNKRFIFIADSGDHTIKRVRFSYSFEACPQHRYIEAYASGPFNTPRGLATAADGSVYVADSGNHVIRRIAPDGTISTIAGEPGVPGSDEHHLNTPAAVEVRASDGALFIADSGNHAIRMLTAGGLVTIAGRAGVAGYADGGGEDALFNGPVGLKFAADGSLYVADTSNQVVRRIAFVAPEERRRAVRR